MGERICYVFGAGDWYDPAPTPGPDDLVIAADGGYLHLQALGLSTALIIGDFDSMPLPREEDAPPLIVLPREKDEPDMLHALRLGLNRGYTLFHIYGGTGGRLDHTLANLQCLLWLQREGARGLLFDKEMVLTILSGERASFPPGTKGLLSIFALSEEVSGVYELGLRYPLHDAVLHSHYPLGLSNTFTGEEASVSVEYGALLLTYPRGAEVRITALTN